MSIALIGYRGSGKTTIGRKLADRLWHPFVDTDERIVAMSGKSIKEIFAQDGEPHFRDLETEALRQACGLKDHVISLGGGAVLREENRKIIRDAGLKVIYLRCDPAMLLQRIENDPQSQATRPSLTQLGGGIDEIRSILAQREPIYRQTMTAELDVTNLTPDEAIIYIARMI